MAPRPVLRAVLLSAPDTMPDLERAAPTSRLRWVRIPLLERQAVPVQGWLPRALRSPGVDTVVVTSRFGVTAGVVPWMSAGGRRSASTEYWAAGPETARALREVGIRRVRRPKEVGAAGISRAMARSRRRNILYFRSDLAGVGLARELRRQGHRATEIVAYRTGGLPTLGFDARASILSADLIVAASPSALFHLRRLLAPTEFERLRGRTRLVVLGRRTLRSARGHGFSGVVVVPPAGAQRFTRRLLGVLGDARS